ncbi:MAG TPA: Uma2 family endonuclease [Pseudonocardiaceae bacterium]|nr:Uma2 family endonuclease [Pseudonocardiaceae bacterium]
MAAGAHADMLEHVGPWTEQDYLALPADRRRIELLDGSLLVSPSAGYRHQRLSFQLCYALAVAAPVGLEVLEAINVRVAPGRILIPDLAVVSTPGVDRTLAEPADVVLVVEITSPGNAVVDRAVKPELYAQAGIPHYLLIELGAAPPAAVAFGLRRGRYVPVRRVEPGERLRLDEPFAVDVDLAALATATRPPRST